MAKSRGWSIGRHRSCGMPGGHCITPDRPWASVAIRADRARPRSRVGQVRTRLSAGGEWIRTTSTAFHKQRFRDGVDGVISLPLVRLLPKRRWWLRGRRRGRRCPIVARRHDANSNVGLGGSLGPRPFANWASDDAPNAVRAYPLPSGLARGVVARPLVISGLLAVFVHLGSRSECESDQHERDGHVCYERHRAMSRWRSGPRGWAGALQT